MITKLWKIFENFVVFWNQSVVTVFLLSAKQKTDEHIPLKLFPARGIVHFLYSLEGEPICTFIDNFLCFNSWTFKENKTRSASLFDDATCPVSKGLSLSSEMTDTKLTVLCLNPLRYRLVHEFSRKCSAYPSLFYVSSRDASSSTHWRDQVKLFQSSHENQNLDFNERGYLFDTIASCFSRLISCQHLIFPSRQAISLTGKPAKAATLKRNTLCRGL